MIKVENTNVWGFEHAIRGMRNPMDSWARSDSRYEDGIYKIGEEDLNLMKRLFKAGTEHRKYLRQIFVSMDITAPLYWWKEFDTYKVGTTANSCSTMHTLHKHGINEDIFSFDGDYRPNEYESEVIDRFLHVLDNLRIDCKPGDEKWRFLVQLLPEGFNQRRTVTLSYENVFTILKQRKGHLLGEWKNFCTILEDLPKVKELADE